MATRAGEGPHATGTFGTNREDLWWFQPLIIAIGFTAFIVYSTWAAFVGSDFIVHSGVGAEVTGGGAGNELLSPFYSPCLGEGCVGPLAGLIPVAVGTFTPALYILWAPLGFRATCYYYRKAYYRAYFADPAACAVEEPRSKYKGETAFPWILQNLHRYFLPFALALVVFLSYDAILAMAFPDGFGISVGTLVLTANVVLLGGYTFGCHALRHLVGGGKDCMTCDDGPNVRRGAWSFVSWFNKKHMLWAWLSLFWVAFTDLYVRLVATGVITDLRLI